MITSILFDFDGVVVETESQYDIFFDNLAEQLNINIPDFAQQIKGTRLIEVLDLKFPQLDKKLKDTIIKKTFEFERDMDYPLLPGVMDFIAYLKNNNYKIALVTSSMKEKMDAAMDKLNLQNVFDVEIFADQISKGKPDPMCYRLAAKKLNVSPSECLVFEDSIAGIESAIAADMKVVGVTSTLSEQELSRLTNYVISDFTDTNNLMQLINRI